MFLLVSMCGCSCHGGVARFFPLTIYKCYWNDSCHCSVVQFFLEVFLRGTCHCSVEPAWQREMLTKKLSLQCRAVRTACVIALRQHFGKHASVIFTNVRLVCVGRVLCVFGIYIDDMAPLMFLRKLLIQVLARLHCSVTEY